MKNNTKREKNFIKKYLAYPIGEILLLVIGIYIAVQINNWNEGRKDEKIARKHLRVLRNNLDANIKNNDIYIKHYNKDIERIEYSQRMLLLNPDTISDKTLVNIISKFGPLNGSVSYRSSCGNMMNDNSLQSLKNDTLKGMVFFLGTIYDYNMKQTKENSRNWDEYMLPYLVKNVNFAYFSDSIPLEDIVPQMKKVKREAFIYNTEFFYILTIRNGFVRSYIRLFENENKIYKSTIASIERYLDIKPIEKKEELNEDKKELEEKEGESK